MDHKPLVWLAGDAGTHLPAAPASDRYGVRPVCPESVATHLERVEWQSEAMPGLPASVESVPVTVRDRAVPPMVADTDTESHHGRPDTFRAVRVELHAFQRAQNLLALGLGQEIGNPNRSATSRCEICHLIAFKLWRCDSEE
jgi:hypothetical protein